MSLDGETFTLPQRFDLVQLANIQGLSQTTLSYFRKADLYTFGDLRRKYGNGSPDQDFSEMLLHVPGVGEKTKNLLVEFVRSKA
jgi:endonuclease III